LCEPPHLRPSPDCDRLTRLTSLRQASRTRRANSLATTLDLSYFIRRLERSGLDLLWQSGGPALYIFVNGFLTAAFTGFKAVGYCRVPCAEFHYSRCHETAEQ
jgi:hypothetical protein